MLTSITAATVNC